MIPGSLFGKIGPYNIEMGCSTKSRVWLKRTKCQKISQFADFKKFGHFAWYSSLSGSKKWSVTPLFSTFSGFKSEKMFSIFDTQFSLLGGQLTFFARGHLFFRPFQVRIWRNNFIFSRTIFTFGWSAHFFREGTFVFSAIPGKDLTQQFYFSLSKSHFWVLTSV